MADPTPTYLDLAEFGAIADRAVLACAGLAPRAQATRLADDGLFGILTPAMQDGSGCRWISPCR